MKYCNRWNFIFASTALICAGVGILLISLAISILFKPKMDLPIGEIVLDGCPIFKLAFRPSGNSVAIGTSCGNTSSYDLSASNKLQSRVFGNSAVLDLTYSTDGTQMAIGYSNGTVSILRVAEEMTPLVSMFPCDYQIKKLAISPCGKYVVILGSSSLTIWKIQKDTIVMRYRGEICRDFVVAHNIESVISLNLDGSVSLRRFEDGVISKPVFQLTGDYHGLSITGKGDFVALSDGTRVDVFKIENDELKKYRTIVTRSECLGISSDGPLLASGDQSGVVSVWDINSASKIMTLQAHHGPVNTVAFSPSALILATGGQDELVKLWTVRAGKGRLEPFW